MRLAVPLLFILSIALTPVSLRADEVPHARAYLDQLHNSLVQIEYDLTMIADAADRAAEAVANGKGMGVRGDAGLANELSNRAGSLMGYDGRAGEPGDVIVFVFGLTPANHPDVKPLLIKQLDQAQRLRAEGSTIIGIGSLHQLTEHGLQEQLDQACHAFLDNHQSGDVRFPLQATVLNAAVAWTFQCELFASLTRLDRVAVVRQSFETDTRRRRWERYVSQPFHHDRWLDPIAPGKLGTTYLSSLRDVLNDIGTASWRSLAKTADRAERTLATGGMVWLRAGGRYLPYHVGGQLADDPGLFTLLNHDGSNPALPAPGKHDYVIAVGRYETAGSYEWGEPELLQQAGRGVAWVVNGYNTQPRDLLRNEMLIDLWGPVGDCVVKVQDYDTRLGPVSGVTSEAVLGMIAAEVRGRHTERAGN